MSFLTKIRRKFWLGLQKTPFYTFSLMSRTPTNLAYIATDLWPGEGRKGRLLLEGKLKIRGQIIPLSDLWSPENLDIKSMQDLHSFAWLRDLRSVGDNASRRLARQLILSWIDHHQDWTSPAWEPGVIGHRLGNWLALYEFFCASADETFRGIFFKSLSRQAIHLSRSWEDANTCVDRLYALKGLIFCQIFLWGNRTSIPSLISHLEEELSKQLMTDGTHISKDPSIQLTVLQDLIDVRTIVRVIGVTLPTFIPTSIFRMAPVVRLFRHGDGRLASFGGNSTHAPALVDVILSLADAKGRPPARLVEGGFERCASKNGLLLLKMGEPTLSLDPDEGTGLFKFEWSVGRDRLVQNGDTILENPQYISNTSLDRKIERHSQHGHTLLNMSVQDSGYSHQRQIYVSEDHADLRGEDSITVGVDMGFAVRFVMGEHVESIKVTPDGRGAIFKTKSGHLWRLLTSGAEPIICEGPQTAICLFGHAAANLPQTIKWAFRRD